MENLKNFDYYPKLKEEYQIKTTSGAAISIVSCAIILFLLFSEFAYYLQTETHHELFVDTSIGEKLRINFDVTFPNLPCIYISVDSMDVSGNHQLDVDHDIFKKRLDENGNAIGSDVFEEGLGDPSVEIPEKSPGCGDCYGAETEENQCCNTCADVQEAYRKRGWAFSNVVDVAQCRREGYSEMMKSQENEGCQLYGHLVVSKAAGNFHFAPGKSFQRHHMHVHDLQPLQSGSFDLSHRINHISFGDHFPGLINPLDGVEKNSNAKYAEMYQYFTKVVPTTYQSVDGTLIKTNQFSVTEHSKAVEKGNGSGGGHSHGLPGVFIMYDLSPIMVHVTETSKSFAHFLTGVCAIVGGVFTVTGIIDAFVYKGLEKLKKQH